MRFTWDPEKNRINVRRHGLAFQDAARIFEGPTLEKVVDRFDYRERRICAIGLVNGVEVTVIYTDCEHGKRRLLSAWRSEPHERRAYWKEIKEKGG